MITLKNIKLRHGAAVLLEDVNWTIYARQRIGLIGANGSGKTTLFSFLMRRFQADAGDIDYPRHLSIAHVQQETPALTISALDFVQDGDEELRALQAELAKADEADDGMRMAEIFEKLAVIDAYTAPTRAAQLLSGLGFSHEVHDHPVSAFSGGWRVRLNLAKALMKRSDMLLLDEPTNHLDLDAIIWLEEWLKAYQGTMVVISHDRDFLDGVVDHIAHISDKHLKVYTGNYSTFETQRAAHLMQQQAMYEKQQRQISHMQHYVDRFRYKASKAKQAQSRLKAIERMELVSAVQAESPFRFEFREAGQCPNPLLSLNHVDVAYGAHKVLANLNYSLTPKDRIAVLGPNGAGKSSFIKILAQELAPAAGQCVVASGLRVGYFAQHQIDYLDLNASPLIHMRRIAERTSELELRKFLGGFDFSGDRVLEPVKNFSGGEKTRLALAMIVWQQPNLLLLDEPTNHLDMEMRNALSLALTEYNGAMILVSHDRFLVRSAADRLLLCAEGKIIDFDGDLNDYQRWLFDYTKRRSATPVHQQPKAAPKREVKKPSADKINRMEKELTELQAKAANIEQQLTDEALYLPDQKDTLNDHLARLTAIKANIEKLEAEWLAACEERDQANS